MVITIGEMSAAAVDCTFPGCDGVAGIGVAAGAGDGDVPAPANDGVGVAACCGWKGFSGGSEV